MTQSEYCGKCTHFKPNQNGMFFNCLYAKHAGVNYGMQVRSDSRACDAFSSPKYQANPKTTVRPPQQQQRAEPPHRRLGAWQKIVLVAAIIIIVLLLAWAVYACVKGTGAASPTPTPTPVPTVIPGPTPTVIPTPSPAPTPAPIFFYKMGEWVRSSDILVNLTSVERTKQYSTPGPVSAPPGTSFIFIALTIVNPSSSTISVQATDYSLVDSSGFEYTPRALSNSFYDAFPYHTRIIQPGSTLSGKIQYVVPDVSLGLEIHTVLDGHTVAWPLPY